MTFSQLSYTGACVDEAVKGKSIMQTDKLVIRRRNEPARAFDRLEHQENFMMMTFRQGSAAAMIDRLDCLKKSHSSRELNIFPFIIKTFERTPGDVWINGLLAELSGTSCDLRTLRLKMCYSSSMKNGKQLVSNLLYQPPPAQVESNPISSRHE